jgi:hypothetical protein
MEREHTRISCGAGGSQATLWGVLSTINSLLLGTKHYYVRKCRSSVLWGLRDNDRGGRAATRSLFTAEMTGGTWGGALEAPEASLSVLDFWMVGPLRKYSVAVLDLSP